MTHPSSTQLSVRAGILANLATRQHGTSMICLASLGWLVTFGTLAGTFQNSPLKDVLWTYQEMKARHITANRVFAETFLLSVLGGGRLKWSTNDEVFARENLGNKPKERLQAARKALNDFESQRIELSGLCRQVRSALTIVGF